MRYPVIVLPRILFESSKTCLLCSNLIGDVKGHDEPVSELRFDIGDLKIDLIIDLLLACRPACYLAN
jgi:hypothetical protein